jgi:phospholipase/lecithinase/hemolysin
MRRIIASLVVGFLLLAPALAGAASFKALYAFGDSLTDAGIAVALSAGAFPLTPPYAGRFSNGPVAAEYLAALMGVPAAPAVLSGTNFAVGGATTGTENFNYEVGLVSPPALPLSFETTGIQAQIAGALAFGPAFHPATTLFLVWGGPNDVFLGLFSDPTQVAAAAAQAVENLVVDVALLAQAGGRYFLVPNMPDLGATPFGASLGPAGQADLTTLTQGFNAALAAAMADLEDQLEGPVHITVFDTFAAQGEILADPVGFGFTDATSFCLADPAALPDCEGYVFFDPVHPTTAAHRILAERFAGACPGRGKSCAPGAGGRRGQGLAIDAVTQ